MREWWRRNAPMVVGVMIATPAVVVVFWPAWGWSVGVIAASVAILSVTDEVIQRS